MALSEPSASTSVPKMRPVNRYATVALTNHPTERSPPSVESVRSLFFLGKVAQNMAKLYERLVVGSIGILFNKFEISPHIQQSSISSWRTASTTPGFWNSETLLSPVKPQLMGLEHTCSNQCLNLGVSYEFVALIYEGTKRCDLCASPRVQRMLASLLKNIVEGDQPKNFHPIGND